MPSSLRVVGRKKNTSCKERLVRDARTMPSHTLRRGDAHAGCLWGAFEELWQSCAERYCYITSMRKTMGSVDGHLVIDERASLLTSLGRRNVDSPFITAAHCEQSIAARRVVLGAGSRQGDETSRTAPLSFPLFPPDDLPAKSFRSVRRRQSLPLGKTCH